MPPIKVKRRTTPVKPATPTLPTKLVFEVPAPISQNNKVFAIADARARLAEIFSYVTSKQERCYVISGDSKKIKFMTFDYKERHMVDPIIDININQLKGHFSTFSTFVRLGMCFRVSRRTSNNPVFMRRSTNYKDPLDNIMTDYIERRTRKAVEDALTDPSDVLMADYIKRRTCKAVEDEMNAHSKSKTDKALLAIRHAQENYAADIMAEIKKVSTGIGRMAVNRHPFNDVPLRKDVIIVGDGDE